MHDPSSRPGSLLESRPGAQAETPTELQIEVSLDGPGGTMRLGGELDLATVAQLRDALHLVCVGEHRLVVIDLGELRFLSLVGLQVLAEAQHTLQAVGCRLVLFHPDALTVRVLALTGLDQVLHLASDTEHLTSEAVADAGPGVHR